MTTYAIHAQILTHDSTWSGSRSVPMFYLYSQVQGITSTDHAECIARDVLNPLGLIPVADIQVRAYVVPDALPREAHVSAVEAIVTGMGEAPLSDAERAWLMRD